MHLLALQWPRAAFKRSVHYRLSTQAAQSLCPVRCPSDKLLHTPFSRPTEVAAPAGPTCCPQRPGTRRPARRAPPSVDSQSDAARGRVRSAERERGTTRRTPPRRRRRGAPACPRSPPRAGKSPLCRRSGSRQPPLAAHRLQAQAVFPKQLAAVGQPAAPPPIGVTAHPSAHTATATRHPSLRAAIVRCGRRIFHEIEQQHACEKRNRCVVVRHH